MILQAIDQLGTVLPRQFAEAIIEVCDGVKRVRQLSVKNDLVGKQHGHRPV